MTSVEDIPPIAACTKFSHRAVEVVPERVEVLRRAIVEARTSGDLEGLRNFVTNALSATPLDVDFYDEPYGASDWAAIAFSGCLAPNGEDFGLGASYELYAGECFAPSLIEALATEPQWFRWADVDGDTAFRRGYSLAKDFPLLPHGAPLLRGDALAIVQSLLRPLRDPLENPLAREFDDRRVLKAWAKELATRVGAFSDQVANIAARGGGIMIWEQD